MAATYSGSDKRLAYLFENGAGAKEVTQAEYNALPDTKLTDSVPYYIKDADSAIAAFISGTTEPDSNNGMDGNLYIKTDSEETTVENIYFKIANTWIPLLTNGNLVGY